MRMAGYQLIGNVVHNVLDIELQLLVCNFRIEKNMKHQVAKLFFNCVPVVISYGIGQLV